MASGEYDLVETVNRSPADSGSVSPPHWICLLKLARHRYRIYQLSSFAIGFLASRNTNYRYLTLGMVAIMLHGFVQEYANMVSDQVEDAVDYPERTKLCQHVGYQTLKRWTVLLTFAYALVVIPMIFMVSDPPILRRRIVLTNLWVMMIVLSLLYSFGLRIKRRTVLSPFFFSVMIPAGFLVGWRATGDLTIVPWVLVLFLLRASCSPLGYKDLVNLSGDSIIGYRSPYFYVVAGRHALIRVIGILSMPYVATILLTFAELLPKRALFILPLFPVGLTFGLMLLRAETYKEREGVREVSNYYQLALMVAILLALYPETITLVVSVVSFIWFAFFARYLHTDPDLQTRETLKAISGLLKLRGQSSLVSS